MLASWRIFEIKHRIKKCTITCFAAVQFPAIQAGRGRESLWKWIKLANYKCYFL